MTILDFCRSFTGREIRMQNLRPNVVVALVMAMMVTIAAIAVVAFAGVQDATAGMILTANGAFIAVIGNTVKELVAPTKSDLEVVLEHISGANEVA